MTEVETVEVDLLVAGVRRVHGQDLGELARPLLLTGLRELRDRDALGTFSAAQAILLRDRARLTHLVGGLGERRRTLFGDPAFWRGLREHVVPVLRTHPSLRVWHVECGQGEDSYALAALLEEEGLLGRSRIYATDANEQALAVARLGAYTVPLEEAEARYRAAGGMRPLAELCSAEGDRLVMRPALRSSLFFTQHHLATDSSFNEFHLVLCRDVLLRFSRPAHERICAWLVHSLVRFGFLALGPHESPGSGPSAGALEPVEGLDGLHRRVA